MIQLIGDPHGRVDSRRSDHHLFPSEPPGSVSGNLRRHGADRRVILSATFQLQPVQSAFINQKIIKCQNLGETIDAFHRYHLRTYSVAWIDCLSQGKEMGRSLLMIGEHAPSGRLRLPETRRHSVPFDVPGICLNSYSVSLVSG